MTVLFLHGGAWTSGSPRELEPLAVRYRQLGYNAISIEYRDGNNHILHLIDNVRAQVSKYRSRGPVILYGSSAGATLAAAVAATGEADGAVVIGGPTNLETWSANPYLGFVARRILRTIGVRPKDYRDASPIHRLADRPAPQLLHYGDIDRLVPVEQATSYARAARRLQPETRIETLKGIGHTARLAYTPSYARHALSWIQRHWPVAAER